MFFDRLYRIMKAVRGLNVPSISWVHGPLYHLYKLISGGVRFFLQKFIWEPLFKSRCKTCGRGLRLLLGIPLLSDHLQLTIGSGVVINGRNTFSAAAILDKPSLVIGNNTAIGYLTSISAAKRVTIGDNCLIAERIVIADNNGHPLPPNRRHQKVVPSEIGPVTIGNNVWIANGAFIGKGVTIGDGAVVGANAVVIDDVPPNSVVAGVPAKVIRTFDENEIMQTDHERIVG